MYWETFTVNSYPFIASIDGLTILEHPLVDDKYLDSFKVAIEVSDMLKPFVEEIHCGGLTIESLEDAIAYFRRVESLSDYEAFAAHVKALGKTHNIALPKDLYYMIEAVYQLYYYPPLQKTSKKQPSPNGVNGFVYLIKSSSGFWKIGRTVDPANRMKTFSVKLPFEVEYEHLIPCADMVRAELQLHERFFSKRANGEWFNLDEADVAEIKAIEKL